MIPTQLLHPTEFSDPQGSDDGDMKDYWRLDVRLKKHISAGSLGGGRGGWGRGDFVSSFCV